MWSVKCKFSIVKSELQGAKGGGYSVKCRVWSVKCKV